MGRIGLADDNAAMESLFSLLHKKVLNRRPATSYGPKSLTGSKGLSSVADY